MSALPVSLMLWAVDDAAVEDPRARRRAVANIARAGFGGAVAFIRCSRYAWDEGPAIEALADAGRLCIRHRLAFWLGADPRGMAAVPREGGGVPVVLYGDAPRASVVPQTGRIRNGRFSVRCSIAPRAVHTMRAAAITYTPERVLAACAVRTGRSGCVDAGVVDVADRSRLFHHAGEGYVEAFGSAPRLPAGDWRILPFFLVRTNHFDFSDRAQLRAYLDALERLARAGVHPDGLAWDEAGYSCQHGALPFSAAIERAYARSTGRALRGDLPKLALDWRDGSHIPVRIAYFDAVQRSIGDAHARCTAAAKRLWGEGLACGIHDTWHWESADMSDRNHGSLDLWEAGRTRSAGFVDLGSVQLLARPASDFRRNLAAMCAVGRTLGARSAAGVGYMNAWFSDEGEWTGTSGRAMDQCLGAMRAFGLRWLAHMYGPAGTIGKREGFLDLPYTPGYPEHPTWKSMRRWNGALAGSLPAPAGVHVANVLVLFPVESALALAERAADAAADRIFHLVLALLDAHFQLDVLSTRVAARGRMTDRGFRIGRRTYAHVVLPEARICDPDLLATLASRPERTCRVGVAPLLAPDGTRLPATRIPGFARAEDLVAVLSARPELRPLRAPAGSWATAVRMEHGTVVTLAPASFGATYAGELSWEGRMRSVPRGDRVRQYLFSDDGRIVER